MELGTFGLEGRLAMKQGLLYGALALSGIKGLEVKIKRKGLQCERQI